ncbi:MAG: restriction endonuclease subunit M [Neisseria sp.]|nr:restriction endonuclease subunit M [Neisseria sp.]
MSALTDLTRKLEEIFQTDRADLDFGIYKILNSRADDINRYLRETLPQQIQAALNGNEAQETAVYNHLLTFFSRYYDAGDFISQRRYKGNTYAIPYNGEEVLLHWANKDQYYTKSGENFSNYRFSLADGKQVFFKLIQADTAKDNQKDNNQTRMFVLAQAREAEYDEDGEEIRAAVAPIAESSDGEELTLHFEYKTLPKGEKQPAHIQAAIAAVQQDAAVQQRWAGLFERAPTDKNPNRTVLEKHLSDYSQKNSADYFIHKDLGGFLNRELDFYIKSEVMDLDNIQHADSFERLSDGLKQIQTLRRIARHIIAFLAQLENFQKKLWLKKKFVVGHHYLITLDRIPAAFHDEIFANPKQATAWKNLFSFNALENRGGGGKPCRIKYL